MSPRPYRLGKRNTQIEDTRDRVLDAARDVFSETGFANVTLDDVAIRAGVSRATVYYQFDSKTGLLEAVIERVATRIRGGRMERARNDADPRAALLRYISEESEAWEEDADFFRNVAGLAVLDPDVAALANQYQDRRREGLTWIVKRLHDTEQLAPEVSQKRAVDFFWTLTSFRSYDHLRRYVDTSRNDTVRILRALAQTLLAPDSDAP